MNSSAILQLKDISKCASSAPRDKGVARILISSDMEEVIGISERIAVTHEEAIAGMTGRPIFSKKQ